MEGNSIKSLENLCKIFEMRIKLDKEKGVRTSNEVIDTYENYSKKIDNIYNKEFEKEIRNLISPETTLEKEETRLKRLIKLLEERLDKRNELEEEFYNTTGSYIEGFQLIVSNEELEEKKKRLELISRYLTTKSEIDEINEGTSKLKKSLNELEKEKTEYTEKNKLMEEKLYSILIKSIKNDEYLNKINEDNYQKELDNTIEKVRENEETLEVTLDSVKSLEENGTNDDYTSYVEDAEKSFYIWKNRNIIIKIYELVIAFQEEFEDLVTKRQQIEDLLEERKESKNKLHIEEIDELLDFESTLLEQKETLNKEKEILDNIVNYVNRIKFKEERLNELEDIINTYDILTILREYGIIESYDTEEEPQEEMILEYEEEIEKEPEEEKKEESSSLEDIINDRIDPYRIKEINDYPKTLNLGLAKLKAESVRENVNRKLNPKPKENIFDNFAKEIKEEQDTVKEKQEIPNWTLPQEEPKPLEEIKLPEEPQEETLPVWKQEEPSDINKIELPNNINENMFWTPVADTELENKTFPNINNINFPNIN